MTENPMGPLGWTPERLGSLSGKTQVITGANSGTGFQAARTLLTKGAQVVMLNRSTEKSTAAIATIMVTSSFAVCSSSGSRKRRAVSWSSAASATTWASRPSSSMT